VIGLETLTKEEVLGVAAIPQESSLLSIDPELLATRLEGHPWIASASVERVLPHTLAINLSERNVAAILRSKDGDHFLDAQGYVLPSRSEKTVPSLPILVGLDSQTLASQRETDRQRAQKGIQVATLLSEEFQSVPTLDVSHLNSIVAELPDVRFQFGPFFREQWQRFRMLHPSIRTDGEPLPQEIDLRYPGKVIFRRKG
jgi:cell division septal protein FtsQ